MMLSFREPRPVDLKKKKRLVERDPCGDLDPITPKHTIFCFL
jgi:hypothetical protein